MQSAELKPQDGVPEQEYQLAPDGLSLIFAEASVAGPSAWQEAMQWQASLPSAEALFQPLVPGLPHACIEDEHCSEHPPSLPDESLCPPSPEDSLLTGGVVLPAAGHGFPSTTAADTEDAETNPPPAGSSMQQCVTVGGAPWRLEPSPPDDGSDGSSVASRGSSPGSAEDGQG